MTGRDERAQLAAAHTLGALDADDATTYESYLAEQGGERADDFASVTESLALAVEPVGPPGAMKAALMEQLASTPQLPVDGVVAAPDAQPVASVPTTKAASAAASAKKTKAQLKAERRWYTQPLAAAIAAVGIVVAMLGADLVTRVFNGGNGLSQSLALSQINARSDVQRHLIKLTGVGDEHTTTMTLVWSESIGRSALVVEGLPSLGADENYALWYIGEDGTTPAGLFNTGHAGDAWRVLDGVMDAGGSIGVTIESAGGAEQPTGKPLVVIPTS